MRRILRVAKSAVVLSLVFMMTVDTANACRLFSWLFAHRGACCASSAETMGVSLASAEAMPVSYAPPVIEAAPIFESYPIASDISYGVDTVSSNNCCCCDAGLGGGIVDMGYADPGYVEGYSDSGFVDQGYVDGGYIDGGYSDGGYVESGEMIMDASPVDLAPTDTIVAPMPAIDDAAPTPAPVAESAFDTTTDDMATDVDMAADTGFGDSTDDTEPAETGFGDTADNPLTDSADDAPAGDDLFDAPAGDTPDEGGDLFDNAPGDDAGDDLFDGGGDAADDGDGLFGGTAPEETVPASVEEAPVDATSPAENSLDDLDDLDLFGQRGNGMRVWTDNTGSYQTVGRLVVIAKTHVRLLKDNGRYSTVQLTRLSERDVEYVMAVAVKLAGPQRLASR